MMVIIWYAPSCSCNKRYEVQNINLISNKEMISINKKQFLTSIENNLQSRLLDNDGEN